MICFDKDVSLSHKRKTWFVMLRRVDEEVQILAQNVHRRVHCMQDFCTTAGFHKALRFILKGSYTFGHSLVTLKMNGDNNFFFFFTCYVVIKVQKVIQVFMPQK